MPKTRRAVLSASLPHPDRWWYQADLAKHLGVRPSSLQRELAALAAAGIFSQRRDGNRVYYRPNLDCPIMPELRGLIVKTAGAVDVLREALSPLADRIRWAFVYGSFARGAEQSDSDVDLMVIGDVGLAEVSPLLRNAQQRLGREINPTGYSTSDFANKLRAGYGFHRGVLDNAKLFVIGDDRELAAALEGGTRRGSPREFAESI